MSGYTNKKLLLDFQLVHKNCLLGELQETLTFHGYLQHIVGVYSKSPKPNFNLNKPGTIMFGVINTHHGNKPDFEYLGSNLHFYHKEGLPELQILYV